MDVKQFDLFQTAVQWVWDEARRKAAGERRSGPQHNQTVWAAGYVGSRVVPVAESSTQWGEVVPVVCASACCLAGNGVMIHGDEFIADKGYTPPGGYVGHVEHCIDTDGNIHTINHRAQALFGLSAAEAGSLFHQDNGARDIVTKARFIAKCHGYELEVK